MSQPAILILAFAAIAVGAWRTRRLLPFRRKSAQPRFDDAPIRINRMTGSVAIKGSALILRPALEKATFLDSDLYARTTKSNRYLPRDGSGHSFLVQFTDPVFENVYMWLDFVNDSLRAIDFGWGPMITTAEWTQERIGLEVTRYRNFMLQELGINRVPYEFPWGTAYAARDDKAGAPAMGLAYSPRN